MQHFHLNPAMIQFLRPERLGALYNLVRELGELFARIPGLEPIASCTATS